MYPAELVKPMREDLTKVGFEELHTAEAVEAQIGFEDAKLRSITQYLTLAGESEPASSGFRLTSGSCANA